MRDMRLFVICVVGAFCLWWLPVVVALKIPRSRDTLSVKTRRAIGGAAIIAGTLSGLGLYEYLITQRRRK